jgi:hypothetical protein
MTIIHARVLNGLLATILALSGYLVYGWYLAAMHLSLELLNRQHKYLQHAYKRYNSFFVLYTGVLLARLRSFHFNDLTEWLINCTEHFLFAIIICIKLYIYAALFGQHNYLSRQKRALFAFIVFNLVGVLNEVFQNKLAHRELFIFIPDSIRDLQVNLVGAFVFEMVVFGKVWWLKSSPSHALKERTLD